tara:strand:+ start:643 stop:774 length:132 start_codon:yes stop_codon:yes gene_type:complete
VPRPRATTLHATKLAANMLVRKVAETALKQLFFSFRNSVFCLK